jgi:hypothetical protein
VFHLLPEMQPLKDKPCTVEGCGRQAGRAEDGSELLCHAHMRAAGIRATKFLQCQQQSCTKVGNELPVVEVSQRLSVS